MGDFRLVTSGQAASASILECSPPLSCSSPSFSTLRSHISSSAHYHSPGIKDTVIDFILDHLIWVYNGDGLNRLGIGTAACVASRHSESHLAAVHFKRYFVVIWGQLPPGPASGVSKIFLNSDWSIRDTRDCQVFRYRFVYRNILSLGFQILAPGFCHVWCHDTPELVSLSLS